MRNERVEAADQASAELVWLLGQPHLGDYLDFVRAKVIGGESIPPGRLADEWRAANDYYYELEQAEAGAADTGPKPGIRRARSGASSAAGWARKSVEGEEKM